MAEKLQQVEEIEHVRYGSECLHQAHLALHLLILFYHLFSAEDGTILYKLPGHSGTCTAVSLHPKEPISESHFRY